MNNLFQKGSILNLAALVDYSADGIVSKQVLKNDAGNVSLFSFAKGQGLSEHTAPFDAMVQILDGSAEIKIGDKLFVLKQGETIIMPANITHALSAIENFKMLLTMIRG